MLTYTETLLNPCYTLVAATLTYYRYTRQLLEPILNPPPLYL